MSKKKKRKAASKFQDSLNRMGFSDYEEYLASEKWAKKKEEYVRADLPQRCAHCQSPSYLLHHLTYERMGFERLEDFLPLCPGCHHRLHMLMKKLGIWEYDPVRVLVLLKNGSPLALPKKYGTKKHVINVRVEALAKDAMLLDDDELRGLQKLIQREFSKRGSLKKRD